MHKSLTTLLIFEVVRSLEATTAFSQILIYSKFVVISQNALSPVLK
jgi:hypothetical protein